MMLDKWHDAYHANAPDPLHCPYCADALMAAETAVPLPVVSIDAEVDWGAWLEATYDPDGGPIDRLEDLEV